VATRVETVVLGLLAEEPMHGYDVLERFRRRGMGFWVELGRASVYQVLKRLERDGLVTGRNQEGRAGPDRRIFRITRSGRARLGEGVIEMSAALAPFETGAGTALGFAHVVSATTATRAIDARERSLRDLLDAVRTELDRSAGEGDRGRPVSTAMLELQARLAETELDWLSTFRSAAGSARR
jgi:PadR family transcriptional regulator, regulatory protein PadR